MAGFSSTVRPIRPPRPQRPQGVYGSSIPKPPAWQRESTAGPGAIASATPQAPRLAPRPGPQAPGQATGTSGTQSPPAGGSGQPVLDATALNNIASNQFKANNSINSLNNQASNDKLAMQNALAQLAYQQPRDQLSLEQGANQRGALFSSAYNQDLGNQGQQYLTRQNAATTSNDQAQAGIASQIQAILGGIPLYNQGQENASVQRAIAAAAANPATGQPPSLTPEQVKYINAGLAGQKTASSKPSGSITDRGPWQATRGRIQAPPKPRLGVVGSSNLRGRG